jgi:hypothetical protein
MAFQGESLLEVEEYLAKRTSFYLPKIYTSLNLTNHLASKALFIMSKSNNTNPHFLLLHTHFQATK